MRPAAADTADPHTWNLARLSLVTGVSVITATWDGLAHGMTVSTIGLVSRQPPLVSLALRARSTCLMVLKRSRLFVVNVLAVDQAALASYFADPRRPRGLGQLPRERCERHSADGIPLLRGAIAWWECRVDDVIPVGDHELVVAKVESVTPGGGVPLVNFAGAVGGGFPVPTMRS